MALSRHAGFFASLQRVEDRLALEKEEEEVEEHQQEQEQSTNSTTTSAAASPLVLLDHPSTTTTAADSSGPALDFLTLTRHEYTQTQETEEEDGGDIERLMALLGLTTPPTRDHGGGGCDCSGGDGFLAKVVGAVGPKCGGEKRRLDAWIQHFYHHRSSSDEGREPARLAHLLLAKFSEDADGRQPFPATVKDYLDRDAPSSDSV